MTLLPLAFRSLRNRTLSAALVACTVALSVCMLLSVERIRTQAHENFSSTLSGTDLVVGARSGPINLLLYAVFHIGDATNNVSWESYQQISALPDVAWTVPLSLGDSHKGFRVVGTTTAFFTHYRYADKQPVAFQQGSAFSDLYDTVIGAEVARKLGYNVGDLIVLAHGTGRTTIAQHADKPFRISGVLSPTATPLDGSVLVSLAAIEAIHVDWHSGTRIPGATVDAEAARSMDLTPRTITAFLLGLKSRVATFEMQRMINDYDQEPLLAILPGAALQQLWSLMGIAENALLLVGCLVIVVGLIGLITALITTLAERRREMAILRALGARPSQIFGLLLLEAILLTVAGIIAGLALLYLGLFLGRGFLLNEFGVHVVMGLPSPREWLMLVSVLGAGAIAGAIPATMAYRTTLTDGLSIRT